MSELTTKTSAAEFRKIAAELNITLEGSARYKATKEKWIAQINDARSLQNPTKLDIILGIVSYRYTDKAVDLTTYLLSKFKCTKMFLACQISQMLHRDNDLHFDDKGALEVSVKGTQFMAKVLREKQIYVCVADDKIIDTLSYDDYTAPPTGGHHTSFTNYEHYKVFVGVANTNGLHIHSACSNRSYCPEKIFNIIKTCYYTEIRAAIKFWERYHYIMQGSLISLK